MDRISTVWFLTQKDLLWDADIIHRTVLESMIKLLFIIYAPDDAEGKKRLIEFWQELSEVNTLKHSEDAKILIEHFKEGMFHVSHGHMVLSEAEEAALRSKWNRKSRQALEQKWSFSEMLKSLKNNYKRQPFEMLAGLFYEYRFCSHIAHGDELGIGIIAERASRGPEESQIPHRGHFIKRLNDCLVYSSWLAVAVMDYIKEDKKFFFDNVGRIQAVQHLEAKYKNQVFEDPMYDKYRGTQQ